MTQKSFGCLGVVDGKGRFVGMITDGDLRRHMGPELLKARVQDIMTKKPNTLSPDMLASAALEQINSLKRTQMFVVEQGQARGRRARARSAARRRGMTIQLPNRLQGHCAAAG